MKSVNKRGVWFIAISIWTGLFLFLWIGFVLFTIGIMLNSNIELTNPVAEILAYYCIAVVCLSIALFGLMKMIFQLRKAGYIIYTIGLILTLIDLIILKVRMDEMMGGLAPQTSPTIIIIEGVLIIIYILVFRPIYSSKLSKKKNRRDKDNSIKKTGELHDNNLNESKIENLVTENNIQQEFKQETVKSEINKANISDELHQTIKGPQKKNVNYYVFGITVFVVLGCMIFGGFYMVNNHRKQKILVDEKRIIDSIRVADSTTMVQAEQQRIADSITMSQSQQAHVGDNLDETAVTEGLKNSGTWMVILGSVKTQNEAINSQKQFMTKYQLQTEVLNTNNFQNLTKDLFVIVGGKNLSADEAKQLLEKIKTRKIEGYVKDAGPMK